MELHVDVSTSVASYVVISLAGSLDLASRSELTEAATAALASVERGKLTLDLAGLTFIDSTGIGAIVETAGMADDRHVGFALRDPSPRVRRILELTGMVELWPVETTPAES